jgi:hypothetical protein
MTRIQPLRTGTATAALLLAALTCAAAELSFAPVADTSIFSGAGYDNLADGAGPHLWLAVTAGDFNRRALLRFDLSAIPSGSVVREVRLSLYESRARDEHNVTVHRMLASWGEGLSNAGTSGAGAPATPGSATWINRFHPGTPWAIPGGDFVASASASTAVGAPSQRYTWGPTPGLLADVQTWVDNPALNHGWVLIGVENVSQNAKRFESRENNTAANWPQLQVVYDAAPAGVSDSNVPLPPWALALMAAGLGAALLRHKR